MANSYLFKKCFWGVLFILISSRALAQDANYWSSSYNPAGLLTPGAAIAFTRDSGVLYFNPALLGFNTKNTANISGSLYQYQLLNIKNGAGTRLNLNSSNVNIVPVLASGIIALKGKHNLSIAYAIMHNPILNYKATQQRDAQFNLLNDSYSPGNEYFIGQYSLQNTTNETSGILSIGYSVTKDLAVGFSGEAQFRQQFFESNANIITEINTPTVYKLPPFSETRELYQVNSSNIGMRFKFGAAYNHGNHHFGLMVTTPLARISGSGSLLANYNISNLIQGADTVNLLATTKQTNLKERWRLPLSVAAGYAYDLSWGQIYISAEHFSNVGLYNVITPLNQPFLRPDIIGSGMTSDFLKLMDQKNAVTNIGIGISYNFNPIITGFFSAYTDFSYVNKNLYGDQDQNGYFGNISASNNYHVQLGANLKKRKFNLRSGLIVGYGRTGDYYQKINFTNPNEANYLLGDFQKTQQSTLSLGLMFAYIYNL